MPTTGDVIELVHEQTYLGQVCNNVYYFQSVDGSGSLATLATWFETNVVPDIKGFQADILTHVNLRLRNLFDDGETYEEPLTGTGTQAVTTTELPSFQAWAVRFDHGTGNLRPGFKRYAGGNEGQMTDALLIAAVATQIQTAVTHLINPLTPALASYVHVVVNRVCEEVNPTPGAVPACIKYRLPETVEELNLGYITSVEIYSQPTTQNSRKWYT